VVAARPGQDPEDEASLSTGGVGSSERLSTLFRGALAAAALLIFGGLLTAGCGGGDTGVSVGWEPGETTSFVELECGHPKRQLRVVSSPVRDGSRAARFSISPQDVWKNGSVRCLLADYTSGETVGDDYVFQFSILIPKPGISKNLLWELHQPRQLYDIPGCGLAPFAIFTDGRKLMLRIATGDCTTGKGMATFEPSIPISGLDPYPTARWIDIKLRIRFREENDGTVQLWSRLEGEPWPASPLVERDAIPTMPFSTSASVRNVKLYTELGLYPPVDDYRGTDTVYFDAYRRTKPD
jgi:hypothetical protein